MRLFLNGRFQFSVREPTFPIGAFGVFVRSAGETPVTVTFSDLEVYDVDYIPPNKNANRNTAENLPFTIYDFRLTNYD